MDNNNEKMIEKINECFDKNEDFDTNKKTYDQETKDYLKKIKEYLDEEFPEIQEEKAKAK